MDREPQGEDENLVSRRDFLKMSSTAVLGGLLVLNNPDKLFDLKESPNRVEIDMELLPEYFQEILKGSTDSRVNTAGIVEVCEEDKGMRFAPVPVIQTAINENYLDLAKNNPYYRCNEPKGIVFHSFGASQYLLDTYIPNRSAKEYVEGGFAQRTSAMFIVGDEKFDSNKDLINTPPSILQCEIPSPDGYFVPSAHAVIDSKDSEYAKNLRYLQHMNQTCSKFDLPQDISVLQTLHNKGGQNNTPNRSTIGIEITGYDFDNPEDFPSTKKISTLLTLTTAITKEYKISPAFDYLGHREIDYKKSDPGRRLTYLMKLIVGLDCLTREDPELSDLVFGPFIDKTKRNDNGAKKYFDFITTYFRDSSDTAEADAYLRKIDYEKIMSTINNNQILPRGKKSFI